MLWTIEENATTSKLPLYFWHRWPVKYRYNQPTSTLSSYRITSNYQSDQLKCDKQFRLKTIVLLVAKQKMETQLIVPEDKDMEKDRMCWQTQLLTITNLLRWTES